MGFANYGKEPRKIKLGDYLAVSGTPNSWVLFFYFRFLIEQLRRMYSIEYASYF